MTLTNFIDMLVAIEEGRDVKINFKLHDGIKNFLTGFDDPIEFLRSVRDSEAASIENNDKER